MKKLLTMLSVIIFIVSVVLTGGCAEEAPAEEEVAEEAPAEEEVAEEAPAEEEVTLEIWTNLTVESQYEVLRNQVDKVLANMPNVEYTLEMVSFGDMYVRLITALKTGELPNIMHTTEGPPAFLYRRGAIVPVDEIIDELGRDDFISSYLYALTSDNKTWAVPDWALHQEVWYREDLFEEKGLEVPKSWEELIEVSKALTMDTTGDGKTDIYGFAVPMHRVQVAPQTYFQFLYSAGIYVFDPDTGEYIFGDKKEEAAEALEAMIELYHAASSPASIDWSWSDFRNGIVEGYVAQTNEWGAVALIAKELNPEIIDKLGVYAFPGPDADIPPKASLGGLYCLMIGDASDPEVEASKNIVRYLSSPEMIAERALSRPIFALPATKSAYEIYKNDEFVKLFEDETNVIFNEVMPSWYRYGGEGGLHPLTGQIEATTFIADAIQSVALGKLTAEEAVENMHKNFLYQISILGD